MWTWLLSLTELQGDFEVELFKCNKKEGKARFNYIFIEQLWIMLGSRAASHLNHCISATNIDHLITESQLAMKSKDPRHSSEKDQIESIRKMASFMLEQPQLPQNQSQSKRIESKSKPNMVSLGNTLRKGNNAQDNTTFHQKKEKSLQVFQKKNSDTINWIKACDQSQKLINSKSKKLYQACINKVQSKNPTTIIAKAEKTTTNLKQNPSKLNYARHNKKLITKEKTNQGKNMLIENQKKKCKKEASKQQVNKIFEGITSRGNKLLQIKEAKLKMVQQQRRKEELKGHTFTPQLLSCKSLIKASSKGFLQRLKDDEEHRQKKKAYIVSKQLKKTTFRPMINTHQSSQSNSKVDSFRSENLPFFNIKKQPQTDFDQILSRLSSSKNSVRSLTKSSVNQQSNITAKTSGFISWLQ